MYPPRWGPRRFRCRSHRWETADLSFLSVFPRPRVGKSISFFDRDESFSVRILLSIKKREDFIYRIFLDLFF